MAPRPRQIAAGLIALAVFLPLGFSQAPPGATVAVLVGTAVVVGFVLFLIARGRRR